MRRELRRAANCPPLPGNGLCSAIVLINDRSSADGEARLLRDWKLTRVFLELHTHTHIHTHRHTHTHTPAGLAEVARARCFRKLYGWRGRVHAMSGCDDRFSKTNIDYPLTRARARAYWFPPFGGFSCRATLMGIRSGLRMRYLLSASR